LVPDFSMTTTTVTSIPYTGTIQQATVSGFYGVPVVAHLWGAGGGSSRAAGTGGSYSRVSFQARLGMALTVAVGQGGGRGGPNLNEWTPSGLPGAGYSGLLFNTRYPPSGQSPVYPYGQGLKNISSSFTSFISQYGVWGDNQNVQTFSRSYTVNFPSTTNCIFQMVASTNGRVYLDGSLILEGAGRSNTPLNNDTINQIIINVASGNHVLLIEADGVPPTDGNPNAIAVTIDIYGNYTSFSGGRGGQNDSTSIINQGTAGGGGGATILSINNQIVAVAAGGGGGATRDNTTQPSDATFKYGQDGQDSIGYGRTIYAAEVGGGGGGGGGVAGGQGGAAGVGSLTAGGIQGATGISLGSVTYDSTGRIPYTNEYYPGGDVAVGGAAGVGEAGGNGYVILEYQTGGGGSININGEWNQVETTYVKNNGAWSAVTTSYILQNRLWRPIQGVPVPTFTEFQGFIGTASRSYGGALAAPPPPAYDPGYTGGGYGGDGGYGDGGANDGGGGGDSGGGDGG